MSKTLEVFLTVLALAGLYCSVPKASPIQKSGVRAEQAMVIADGSDPMPLCRHSRCTQ